MIITEKLIRKIMIKCWKRGNQYKRHMCTTNIEIINNKKVFNKIEIKIKKRIFFKGKEMKNFAGGMILNNDSDEIKHILVINPTYIKSYVALEDAIAHELAHFIDYCDYRVPSHDFMFLHNWLLLSNKKNTKSVILRFLTGYCVKKDINKIKYYNNILKEGLKNAS